LIGERMVELVSAHQKGRLHEKLRAEEIREPECNDRSRLNGVGATPRAAR
jgi:hypothetical protein